VVTKFDVMLLYWTPSDTVLDISSARKPVRTGVMTTAGAAEIEL
jgi:hypothetical protein